MKRFAALLLAGLLLGSALAGCSEPAATEEIAQLTSQLDAINQRLEQLEESAGAQEGLSSQLEESLEKQEALSSQLDSLAKRLDDLESAAQEQPTPVPGEEPSSSAEEPATAVSTSVEQVVFDEGDLKVTYTGMEDYRVGNVRWGGQFTFSIENNANQTWYVRGTETSINGLMMGYEFWETVTAGKKANTEILIFDNDLADNGIETMETLEFTLVVWGDGLSIQQEFPVTITL